MIAVFEQTSPSPGWYFDGHGLRWWDGSAWGPYAPPSPLPDPTSDEAGKTPALLAHLGGLLGAGFVVSLVVYLIYKDKNPFARRHAAEALNFQLTFLIVWIGGFVLFIATGLATDTSEGSGFPIGFLVMFLGMMTFMILNLVLSVVGAVRASQLREFSYKVRIPFVH